MNYYSKVPYYDKEFDSLIRMNSKLTVVNSLRKREALTYSDSLIDMFLKDLSKIVPIYYKNSKHIRSTLFKTYEEALSQISSRVKTTFISRIILNSICYIDDSVCIIEVYNDEDDKEISSNEYWTKLRDSKFNKLLDD